VPQLCRRPRASAFDSADVKLLFDQNISPRLVLRLADIYPLASHVSLAGLDRATDDEVWAYAEANTFVIVTKDADFSDVSVLRGFPPKVVWLRLGNCTTTQIEQALRRGHAEISVFYGDPAAGLLELL
jgi:predicted nuclease of predicted toxin-antitoxin system